MEYRYLSNPHFSLSKQVEQFHFQVCNKKLSP